jgi:hypothetical protein
VGYQAGYSNTTGTGQTFLGTNAGRATTTGDYNTAIGFGALRVNTTGVGNTIVGCGAGDLLTGSYNTIIGPFVSGVAGAGDLMTTGSKNTILGRYNGNQGGLDIRTASNYIVLSDGDGNPRWINDGTDNWGSGVDPSNWVSGFRAIELTNAVALWSQDSTPSSWLTVNAYYDGAWKYKTSAAFSGYNQSGGYHTWYSSASGSANATFTPTQVLATVQGSSLALQGANPQVGTGITFPATQSASSDANTLDDYEEGTWTPAWSGSGTTTYDSGTTAGRYVKVGKICTAWGIVTSTSLTASGSLVRITLPFNVNNSQANFGSVFVFCENGINPSGGAGNVAGINRINDNTIDLYTVSSSTGANYTQLTYNDLQASSTSRIRFTTTFEVA